MSGDFHTTNENIDIMFIVFHENFFLEGGIRGTSKSMIITFGCPQ